MTADAVSQRLSLISTHWSLLSRAHDGAGAEVQAAQRQLLDCYGGAVRRYLLGAVRDPDVAEDLFQEFACKFLRGSLRGADPGRGRFRDFLKGVLRHLATDHHRAARRRPQPLPQDFAEPAVEDEPEADAAFRACWRDELLAHAWQALAEVEKETG